MTKPGHPHTRQQSLTFMFPVLHFTLFIFLLADVCKQKCRFDGILSFEKVQGKTCKQNENGFFQAWRAPVFLLPSPSKYYFHDQVSSTAIDFQQYCYRQVSTTSRTSLVVLPQFQCRAAGRYPFTCRVKALFTHRVKALFTHRVKALFTHRVKALFTHRVIPVFRDFMDNYPVYQQHSQSVGGKTPAECNF